MDASVKRIPLETFVGESKLDQAYTHLSPAGVAIVGETLERLDPCSDDYACQDVSSIDLYQQWLALKDREDVALSAVTNTLNYIQKMFGKKEADEMLDAVQQELKAHGQASVGKALASKYKGEEPAIIFQPAPAAVPAAALVAEAALLVTGSNDFRFTHNDFVTPQALVVRHPSGQDFPPRTLIGIYGLGGREMLRVQLGAAPQKEVSLLAAGARLFSPGRYLIKASSETIGSIHIAMDPSIRARVYQFYASHIHPRYGNPSHSPQVIDELTVSSFLREECVGDMGRASALSDPWYADPASMLDYYRKWVATARPAQALSPEEFLLLLGETRPSSEQEGFLKAHEESWVAHVGDSQASVGGGNTEETVGQAKSLLSEGSRSYLLKGEGAQAGSVTFTFESVNWTEASHISDPATFVRPSMAFIAPADFKGGFSANLAGKRDWARAHGKEDSAIPQYFREIRPKSQKGRQVLKEEALPKDTDYLVWVQAGERRHATDPYDNFDVTVTTSYLRASRDTVQSPKETVILGEEHPFKLEGGRVVVDPEAPEPNTRNSVLNGTPRLTKEAYALYHPWARALARDPKVDLKTIPFNEFAFPFEVVPGRHYELTVDVSGNDATQEWDPSYALELSHLRVEDNGIPIAYITMTQNRVRYHRADQGTQGRWFPERNIWIEDSAGGSGDPYRRYLLAPEKFHSQKHYLTQGYFITEELVEGRLNSSMAVIKVREPKPDFSGIQSTYLKKLVVEVDSAGRWYISEWRKGEGEANFRLVLREQAEDEYDAQHGIARFWRGPMKRIRFPFRAQSKKLTVRVVHPKVWDYNIGGEGCDEHRHDRVRVTEVQKLRY